MAEWEVTCVWRVSGQSRTEAILRALLAAPTDADITVTELGDTPPWSAPPAPTTSTTPAEAEPGATASTFPEKTDSGSTEDFDFDLYSPEPGVVVEMHTPEHCAGTDCPIHKHLE